jgi:UDP-N-acetyl-D-glucosamine dehydrogenase
MTIGIVGLGYVGLPLAVAFAEAGEQVVGVDRSAERVAALRAGRSHVEDVTDARLAALADRIEVADTYGALTAADAILICVPTPLSANREPDLGPLDSATSDLARVLRAGQLVALESTTYPGTTRERLAPALEAGSGLRAGVDFALAYSPERVDPGRADHTVRTTPKVVGGLTPACAERAVAVYRAVVDDVVAVSTPEVAELSKLLENIFRSVNIALVNELAILAHRMGIDIWEVVDAAATKPFGFMPFQPGPGMGGHCLPVDPFYLAWRAREYDFPTEFVELAGKVNQEMPQFCVERVVRSLNDGGLAVRGAEVLVLGVAYKPGVADTRESPALKIVAGLLERGAAVAYHDPHVADLPQAGLQSRPLDEALAAADIAVVVTAHQEIDYAEIAARVPRLLDLRGVTRGIEAPGVERL